MERKESASYPSVIEIQFRLEITTYSSIPQYNNCKNREDGEKKKKINKNKGSSRQIVRRLLPILLSLSFHVLSFTSAEK